MISEIYNYILKSISIKSRNIKFNKIISSLSVQIEFEI